MCDYDFHVKRNFARTYRANIFQSFLQGLLTKDPRKRLSWPYLLRHPFIAESVDGKGEFGLLYTLCFYPHNMVERAISGPTRVLRLAKKKQDKTIKSEKSERI